MEINYEITERDYILFNQYYMMNSDTGKKMRTVVKTVLPIALLCLCAAVGIRNGSSIVGALLGLFFALLFVALTDRIFLWSTKFSVKMMKKTRELPYPQVGKYIFCEDRVTDVNAKGEQTVFYAAIKKACCTVDAVYIFIESNQAFIVPYRLFPDANAKNDFIAFLRTKIYVEVAAK